MENKEILPMGLDEIYVNTLMESGEIINELSNHLNENVDFEPGDRIEVIGGAGIQSGDTGKVVKISGNKVYYRSDKSGETDYMFKGYLKNISTGQSGRLASDEEIERSYDDFKIREFKWNDSNKKTSGFIDIEFPYGEDKVDNFIIYPNGKIAFDNWYPENVYLELIKYINNQKNNRTDEAVINQHSKAFYSQMYDFLKDNEDALDFMKKEFVAAYRNSANKEEYMNNLLKSGALTKTDKEIEDENRNYGKMTTESKQTVNESVTTYNGIYITLSPENGGLKIELTESGKEFAEENGLSEMNFWELMDDVEGNSNFAYISDLGGAGFGLTEAPGIIWGFDIGDDGELIETPDSELFVYDNYMIDDFGVKLAKNGYVIFHGQNKIDEKETKYRFKNLIKYRVTVKHDKGKTKFLVPAVSEEQAKKRVMDNENCPECAIIKVERITESLTEKSDPLYKNHKGLYKTTINGFKVFEYNGKFIVYFNVGGKEHSFMWNGGSKSWEYLKDKLENITPEQALADWSIIYSHNLKPSN